MQKGVLFTLILQRVRGYYQGYKDVLCGSCDSGYGRTQYNECQECRDDLETAFLFVLSVVVLLFLSGSVIWSNLRKELPHQSFIQGTSKKNTVHLRSSTKRTMHGAESGQLAETLPDQQQPRAEIAETSSCPSDPHVPSNQKDPILAKEYSVEIFKVCLRSKSSRHILTFLCYRLWSTSSK